MARTQNRTEFSLFSQLRTFITARITIVLHVLEPLRGVPYALHVNILAYLLSPCSMLAKTFRNLMANIPSPSSGLSILRLRKKAISKCQISSDEQSGSRLLPGLPDEMAQECLARVSRSDYPILACVSKNFKSLVSSGYLYKPRQKNGIQEHWIYISTSLMQWVGFNPLKRRWMAMPQISSDECFKMSDKESLAVGTQLLLFGRETYNLAIWKYSLITSQWSRAPPMLHGRCLFGSASLNGTAIVAGGVDINGKVQNLVEMYDSETLKWEALPGMNIARKMCAGFFMDGKFYVVGGLSRDFEILTCGEEFDFQTNVWRRIMNMYPFGDPLNGSPPLLAVVKDQLYAADKEINVVKKYDKERNIWRVVRELPVRASATGWGMAFRGCGDRLIVVMGQRLLHGWGIAIYGWCPDGDLYAPWDVLGTRENAAPFVENCAIMGC